MIKTKKDINREVMKRLRKDDKHKHRTLSEGLVVFHGITKSIQMVIRKGDIMSFGTFWLYPKKVERFRKRNRTNASLAKAGKRPVSSK